MIDECIRGDLTRLKTYLAVPKKIKSISTKCIQTMISLFASKNNTNAQVGNFCETKSSVLLKPTHEVKDLEGKLNFSYYALQMLCMNYILTH